MPRGIGLSILSKKVVLLCLAAIVLLSVLLRYPLVSHERHQADSYSIHMMSTSICEDGYAEWTFHPLSYLGYYPLSYPSGVPFLISEASTVTGLNIEISIYLLGIVLGVLFSFAVFCLAREFIARPQFALLAALFAVLSPRFVDITYWVGSARGPLSVVMILSIMVMMHLRYGNKWALSLVGGIFLFGCLAIHHMAVLFALFGMAYILSIALAKMLMHVVGEHRPAIAAGLIITVAACVSYVAFGHLESFRFSVEATFGVDPFIEMDSELLTILVSMGVSYTHQIGFIIIFAGLALVMLPWEPYFTAKSAFPVALIVTFIPLFGNALYISLILLPFVCILAGRWISRGIRRRFWRRAIVVSVVSLIAVSVFTAAWSVDRWNSNEYRSGDTVKVDDVVFNDGIYLRSNVGDEIGISNADMLSLQLAAISGVDFFKADLSVVLGGFIDGSDVRGNTTLWGAEFPSNLYVWFEYEDNRRIYLSLYGIMVEGLRFFQYGGDTATFARELFSSHRNLVVVMDNRFPTEYSGRWGTYTSEFALNIHQTQWVMTTEDGTTTCQLSSYAIYQSERTSMYVMELPRDIWS